MAILHAQRVGVRDRPPAGSARVDDLEGVAPHRVHAQYRLEYRATTAQGTRSAARAVRRSPNSAPTTRCVNACRSGSPAQIARPDGGGRPARTCASPVRHGRRQDRHWARAWNPEQIANKPLLRRQVEPGLYPTIAYTEQLDQLGAGSSIGSKGDAYDTVMAEAWGATSKTELVERSNIRRGNRELAVTT